MQTGCDRSVSCDNKEQVTARERGLVREGCEGASRKRRMKRGGGGGGGGAGKRGREKMRQGGEESTGAVTDGACAWRKIDSEVQGQDQQTRWLWKASAGPGLGQHPCYATNLRSTQTVV